MVELQIDDLEGIGEDETLMGGDYPIDKVLIRNESRTVDEVLRRIHRNDYIMDPDFQRDFVWSESKQSRLIESVLMRMPLPALYLAENENGRMVVVDGLQRLSTFRRFVDGNSRLKLDNRPELNRKRFADLPYNLRRRIEDCYLLVYIIDSRVPDRMKFDIFHRVNSGVPLTRPQMRNALYNGKGTRFLRDESDTGLFKRIVDGSRLSKKTATNRMDDRKFVNRFCAFHLLGVEAYQGDMDKFLDNAGHHMNGMDDRGISALRDQFQNGLDNNYRVFRKSAFRIIGRNHRVSDISEPLWDVMLVGLSQRDANLVNSHSGALYMAFIDLLENRDFYVAVTRDDTDSRSAVLKRFSYSKRMFGEVFGD